MGWWILSIVMTVIGVVNWWLFYQAILRVMAWRRGGRITIDLSDPRTLKGNIYFPPKWFIHSAWKRRLYYLYIAFIALNGTCAIVVAVLFGVK